MKLATLALLVACGSTPPPDASPQDGCRGTVAIESLDQAVKSCRHWEHRKFFDLSGEHSFYWCDFWVP